MILVDTSVMIDYFKGVENGLALLHNDKDFDNIKKVIPELTIY